MSQLWNYETALAYVDGDSQLLHELIDMWFERNTEMLDAVRDAVDAGDGRQLARAAHFLKGSLQILCANRVLEQAVGLEQMGAAGELHDATAQLAVLEAEIAGLNAQLQQVQQVVA